MQTKRRLVEDEDYSEDEALRYSLEKRKYKIQEMTGTLSDDDEPESDNESDTDTE